ncbi:potassium channel family protein [Nocardioides montaniterrae]
MSSARRVIADHPNGVLLLGQFAILLGYPFLGSTTAGRATIGVGQLLVILAAVVVVRRTPALNWVAVLFGVPAAVFAVWESVSPETGWVVLTSAALHVPFYLFVSYALIRYVFNDDRVTSDELLATAGAFTVVAWAFAYAYAALQVLWPGAFGEERAWFDLLYLSFTTLTSVGLGDFTPVIAQARAVVVLEEVAGVFYVALVVSRLVGLAISNRRD